VGARSAPLLTTTIVTRAIAKYTSFYMHHRRVDAEFPQGDDSELERAAQNALPCQPEITV